MLEVCSFQNHSKVSLGTYKFTDIKIVNQAKYFTLDLYVKKKKVLRDPIVDLA